VLKFPSLELPVGRSTDLLANAFLCIGGGFVHAQKTGGIDAKFVAVAEDACLSPSRVPVVDANSDYTNYGSMSAIAMLCQQP
jgi:hypothetical protein